MTYPLDLAIDFTGNGLYTNTGESVIGRVRVSSGIVCSRGKDTDKRLAPSAAGALSAIIDNRSGDYYPDNTSSPVYPNVKPGRRVQLESLGVEGGELSLGSGDALTLGGGDSLDFGSTERITLWGGILDDAITDPNRGADSAEMPALGPLARLSGRNVNTSLLQNVTTAEAMIAVLTAAGLTSDDYDIDIGLTVLSFFCVDNEDALTVCQRLRLSESPWATLTESKDGRIVFRNREDYLINPKATAAQMTFEESNTTTILPNPNFKDQIKGCVIPIDERQLQALDKIWDAGEVVVLEPNETRRFKVRGISDPFDNARIPSLVGINAEQLLTPSATLFNGSFVANVNGTTTGAINWNDSTSAIQSIFDTAVGTGNTFVSGTLASGLYVRFINELAAKPIPLITITSSLNTGVAAASIEAQSDGDGSHTQFKIYAPLPLSAGTFKIRAINGNTTTAINFDAADSTIQARLVALPLIGPGQVTVSGGSIDTDVLTIDFDASLGFFGLTIVDATSLRTATASTASIIVTETQKGGGPDMVIADGDIVSMEFADDRVSGKRVDLLITADSSGATLRGAEENTGFQIRAQSAKVVRSQEASYPDDISSIEDSTPGAIARLDGFREIPLVDAKAQAQTVVEYYQNARPRATVTRTISLTNPAVQALYSLDIGYRVKLQNTKSSINHDYIVQRTRFSFGPSTVTFEAGCERV